jgi:hypothetical protein
MIGARKMVMFAIAEIGKADFDHLVVILIEDRGQAEFDGPP